MIALQLMQAKRGGMALIHGIEGLGRASPLQRQRVCRVALGRALAAKIEGQHNAAERWLRIAAEAAR